MSDRVAWEITSRAEWLDRRRQDVTASSIAALFGCHPYLTLDALVAAMRGHSQGSNAAMRAGRILEPAVIAALAEDYPDWRMKKALTYHRMPEHRIGATPDYWLDDDALIQCKTVSQDKWAEWQAHPPLAYTLQTLCEMLVTDRARGVLAVMVRSPSFPVHCFDVARHPEAEARILDAAAAFWRSWGAGEIAAPAPADDLAEMLDDGSFVDLSTDNAIKEILDEYEYLRSSAKDIKSKIGALEHQIKTRVGKAKSAFVPGWRITFGTQTRKEHIIPEATFRVLRVARDNLHEE